jgi:hypothetical protein
LGAFWRLSSISMSEDHLALCRNCRRQQTLVVDLGPAAPLTSLVVPPILPAMAIPKIIHQTWVSAQLPPSFRAFQETWRGRHSGWEYRFYDDAACRRVVENDFPDLLAIYDGCPHPVQRADIFRYLIVAREGGLYADMDMECLKDCTPLLAGRRAVFCVEDRLSPRSVRQLGLRHAERIAHVKIPRYWLIVEEFPMTVTGKIQKFKLAEWGARELGLTETGEDQKGHALPYRE